MIKDKRYNKKADVWCLGIIFYEILCGYFPFELKNTNEIDGLILGDMKDPPRNVRSEGVELINLLLEKDWKKRAGLEEVLGHSFFDGR